MTNAGARAGDALVLTKPLGAGIVTTGIKRGLTDPALERKVIANMACLNDAGPELAERGLELPLTPEAVLRALREKEGTPLAAE